jgi:glucose dehydrogenase
VSEVFGRLGKALALAIGIGAFSPLAACSRTHDLDDAALRDADADSAEWLSYGRTYSEQRHSPLQQIDEASVTRLGLAFSVDMQTLRGLEATPLERDGVLYVTSAWSVVYAIDARPERCSGATTPPCRRTTRSSSAATS